MGRKAAVKPAKRVAQSKQTKKSDRKDFFKQSKQKPVEESEEEEEEEDKDYLAFTKTKKDSGDEYDNKKEVFNLNLKDDSDEEVRAGLHEMRE